MLIDDDESLQSLIEQIAQRDGYDFCYASNGIDGMRILREERPDFLILDVMLPDINGFEVCQKIRDEDRLIHVLFLSAKGDIVDKSIGFKSGADDYLVKPFQMEELSLRIQAFVRRREQSTRVLGHKGSGSRKKEAYRVGDLEIFFGKYEVQVRGQKVQLSSREIEMLELLAGYPGSVFTREEILEKVWDDKEQVDPSCITVFARKIREKIEDNPSKPKYLITVWRVGYKIADKV
jgi:DNA-binding response OmpR family regulator